MNDTVNTNTAVSMATEVGEEAFKELTEAQQAEEDWFVEDFKRRLEAYTLLVIDPDEQVSISDLKQLA